MFLKITNVSWAFSTFFLNFLEEAIHLKLFLQFSRRSDSTKTISSIFVNFLEVAIQLKVFLQFLQFSRRSDSNKTIF